MLSSNDAKTPTAMAHLKRFDIVFNNPERAFFAGQEVVGKIILELAEEKLINEILLELKGRAKTYWTKHSGKSRTHCTQSEPYFCEQLNTNFTHQYSRMAADGKTVERVVPAGLHEIPFSYTLPKNLPTSFEGEFGFIRYTCRAICERPWDCDVVSGCAFTVVGVEDINGDTDALKPATAADSNYTVTFCCRNQGQIHVELTLPRCGFTPGETIHVSGKVNNLSHRTVKSVCVRLKQNVHYKAKTFSGMEHVKSVSHVIDKREKGEVAANSELCWQNEPIVIPSLTPRLSKCGIIEINYLVELEADGTVSVQLPIVVGSIPRLSDIVAKAVKNGEKKEEVRVTITDEAGRTVPDSNGSAHGTLTNGSAEESDLLGAEVETMIQSKKRVRMPSSILSELYPTLPSPYYKESHFGAVDISDEKESVQFGQSKFAPKYPFYTD